MHLGFICFESLNLWVVVLFWDIWNAGYCAGKFGQTDPFKHKCPWDLLCLTVHCCPSGFPRIALRTLWNPIYLLVVLAQVNQAALLAGLATFMAKFIERQFSQTVSFSNMMIGELLMGLWSSKWGFIKLRQDSLDWIQLFVFLISVPQEESVSRWQCWVQSWVDFWCEGWIFR